jgi:hypothetical protein
MRDDNARTGLESGEIRVGEDGGAEGEGSSYVFYLVIDRDSVPSSPSSS